MPWISADSGFDYRLLNTGALEFRDRVGRYQIVWGCTVQGWHEFWERLDLIRALLESVLEENPESTLEQLYLDNPEFQHHCTRCLALNGIDLDWVTPRMVTWLLFPQDVDTKAPLVALNEPYKAQHPPLPGGEALSGRVAFLSALAGLCEGNLNEALNLAKSMPARDVMAAMESRAWAMASQDDKDKAVLSQAKKEMAEMRGVKRNG